MPFDSVTELRASEASWTAVNRSSSCLYTVLASGCAVLQYGRVVKMPNKFTEEQQVYVDIQSVYGFCNGNVKAAVMERRQRRPLRRISRGKTFGIVRSTLTRTDE